MKTLDQTLYENVKDYFKEGKKEVSFEEWMEEVTNDEDGKPIFDSIKAAMREFAKEVIFEYCEASDRPYVDSLDHPPAMNDRWEWFKQTEKGKKLFSI